MKKLKRMHAALVGMLLVLALSCMSHVAHGDVEPFTAQDAFRQSRLQEMFWLPELSGEQVEFVAESLEHPNTRVLEAAVNNVFLHRLEGLAPKLREGVGHPSMYVRVLGRICVEAIESDDDASARLRAALDTELPGDDRIPDRHLLEDFRPLRDLLTSLIVLDEVRAVRLGQKDQPAVDRLELSAVDAELVAWSGVGTDEAIEQIVRSLSTADVAGDKEYTMMQTLHNYPPEAYLPAVVKTLAAQADEDGYGTLLLLRTLRFRCALLDLESRETLTSSLETIAGRQAKRSIETVAGVLETELSEREKER